MKKGILIVILSLALGFLAGFSCRQKCPQTEPEIRVDTLLVHDTITRYKPEYVVRRIVDTMLVQVPVHDTIRCADTVLVQLPREQLEWADSLATVWVSGYRPEVDSIRLYSTTQIVTIRERIPAPRWGLGFQAGVGAGKDGLTPYVGFGIHYNALPLTR